MQQFLCWLSHHKPYIHLLPPHMPPHSSSSIKLSCVYQLHSAFMCIYEYTSCHHGNRDKCTDTCQVYVFTSGISNSAKYAYTCKHYINHWLVETNCAELPPEFSLVITITLYFSSIPCSVHSVVWQWTALAALCLALPYRWIHLEWSTKCHKWWKTSPLAVSALTRYVSSL